MSVMRYFYTPAPLGSAEEIQAEIVAVDREPEELLEEIVGASEGSGRALRSR